MTRIFRKKQFWGALFGIVLLVFCVKDIRVSELRELSERLNFWYIPLALLFSFSFLGFRGLRWKLMVSRQKAVTFTRAVTLYAAGQVLNSVMPALTGQVGRLFLFSRKEELRKTFVFSTVVLEVLFDSVSLIIFILLASIVFPFPSEYRFIGYLIAGATIGMLVLLYTILHYKKGFENWCRLRIRPRWPSLSVGLRKFIRSFTQGIGLLRSSQHSSHSLVFSLASWTSQILGIYMLFHAFGFDIPFAGAAVVMIVNTLVLMIPITPGNAGTFEVAVSTSVAAFGVGRTDAVLFALALHLLDLTPMLTLGLTFFHIERISVRQLSHEHEHAAILEQITDDGTIVEEEEPV